VTVLQTLYNKNGVLLGYPDFHVNAVLWRLDDMGEVELSASYDNPHATKQNLRPGNRILLEFTNGLRDWGGVLDTPRGRTDAGITIVAYGGRKLLKNRITGKNETYSSTAPGTIAETIIDTANTTEATGVLMGDVDTSGSQTRTYHYEPIFDAIQDLAESGYEYVVMPEVVDGSLSFYLQWYETYGRDLSDSVLLHDGRYGNVGLSRLDEQGPIWNKIVVAGKGDWGASHPEATAEDAASIGLYGLREFPAIQSDISDETTLQEIADALLNNLAWPRSRFQLTNVANCDPAGYSEYRVGDKVTLNAFVGKGEWEFNGTVRILSRKWDNEAKTCTLEVKEWDDE
jgi:hypothetical protein